MSLCKCSLNIVQALVLILYINRDHITFFDKLWNNGVNPIYVLITYAISTPFAYLGPYDNMPTAPSSYTFQTSDGKWYQIDDTKEQANALTREILSNIVVALAERYGTHPAVMGFIIGNEQNNMVTRSNCKFWEWIDSIAARVKVTAPSKLTSTTIVDDAFGSVRAALQCTPLTNLDSWGINCYRGRVDTGFDQLFTTFASLSTQALLITEFGCPSSTRQNGNFVMMPDNSNDQGRYLRVHWDDIVAHNTICSGGYAFSWVDEWWKIGNWGVQDRDDARNYAFPGTYADEEAFGLLAVNVDCGAMNQWQTRKDQLAPRAAYYYMAQMYGAVAQIPDVAYQPISYPLCNGQWVGTNGNNNPDVGIPVGQQGPVAQVPLTAPPPPIPVPVPVPVSPPPVPVPISPPPVPVPIPVPVSPPVDPPVTPQAPPQPVSTPSNTPQEAPVPDNTPVSAPTDPTPIIDPPMDETPIADEPPIDVTVPAEDASSRPHVSVGSMMMTPTMFLGVILLALW